MLLAMLAVKTSGAATALVDEIPDETAIFALLVDAITDDDETAPVSDEPKINDAEIFVDDEIALVSGRVKVDVEPTLTDDEIADVSGILKVDVAATLVDDEIADVSGRVKVDVAATLTDDEIADVNATETLGATVKVAFPSTLVCSCPMVFA